MTVLPTLPPPPRDRTGPGGLALAGRAAALASTTAVALLTLFVADVAWEGDLPTTPPALAYLVLAAMAPALAVGVVSGVLLGLERCLPSRLAALVSSTLVLGGSVRPLGSVAADLATGGGAQALLGEDTAEPILLATMACFVLALWLWHRAVMGAGAARAAWLLRALALLGVVAAVGLGWVMHVHLRAYALVVDLGILAVGVLAGTPLALIHVGPMWLRRALLGGVALVALGAAGMLGTSPDALVEGRQRVVTASDMVGRVDRHLFAPPRTATLVHPAPDSLVCPAPPIVVPPVRAGHARNVLVLSIDALRADAVNVKHGKGVLMNKLAGFARKSIYAERAVSTYPATIFALASALTGLPPSRVLFAPKPPESVLKRAGALVDERMAFIPDSRWFRERAVTTLLLSGLTAKRFPDATAQVDALLAELDRVRGAGRSHIFWAHFFEPHDPYVKHKGFDYGDRAGMRYRSEVAYLDAQLGRLFQHLERSGALDDTLVVIFADHGEALGERGGYVGHHVYLDGFMTDVPLVVRAPGVPARRVEGVTSLVDVEATIAEFMGLAPMPGKRGHSLLRGDPPPDRTVVSEAFPIRGKELFNLAHNPINSVAELEARMGRVHESATRYSPKVAVVDRKHRLIVDRDSGLVELRGRNDKLVQDPDRMAHMTAQLARWHVETSDEIYCAVRDAIRVEPPPPVASPTPSSSSSRR